MNLYVDVIRAYTVTLIIKRKTKGIRDSGSKEDEADTVYLLAKELAYDVVTGQTDNLAAALAKTSGKDFVQFANAVEISHSEIGKKVCVTKNYDSGSNFAKYGTESNGQSTTSHRVALCGGKGVASTGFGTAEVLRDFVRETLLSNGSKNWPTSTGTGSSSNDNATAVAGDLTKLTPEEKTIVAGLLAKTIEGGEVVEIRAVSSTFSMVNLGYRNWGFIVIGSLTMQSSEVTFEYSVKYKYAYYI
ncbi:putative major outer membrane protein P44-20 [Anaplasma phagocytophilum str. ApWI1]|uniref:Putative major outer membrane protein P44-20 n=4 Tax=Anaplasma phagocytophilum TaxID=948 RepID=A0A0F3NKA8_ANAPH